MKKNLTLILAALTALTLVSCTMHATVDDGSSARQAAPSAPAAAVAAPEPEARTATASAVPTEPAPAAASTVPTEPITAEEAQAIALAHAQLTKADVTYVHTALDHDDGRKEYEVEFYSGDREYDYEIDALTGDILSFDTELEHRRAGTEQEHHNNEPHSSERTADAPAASQTGELLTEAAVRAIALEHAGLTEADVRFEKVHLDKDDRTWDYDLEFRAGNVEYEYEIDAYTGRILESDMDHDD